jgi:hypothetical protein
LFEEEQMTPTEELSPERLAGHFIDSALKAHPDRRGAWQLASWAGLVILGIEKLKGSVWKLSGGHQLRFEYEGRCFDVQFVPELSSEGGRIEIAEILPGPEGGEERLAATIASLSEAESFYREPATAFQELAVIPYESGE